MSARTIAIGDIHGCAQALQRLLEQIDPRPDDLIIPLGDVIDRGPDSRRVVELLLALRERCRLRPILGNHEEMLLEVVLQQASPFNWIHHGGSATLDSYGFEGDLSVIPPEHIQFLRSFEPSIETATHFFVHANYDPFVPIPEQRGSRLRWLSLDRAVPPPHLSGRMAIVGHTPDRSGEIFALRHLKCLDTYCHGGGWLTALDVGSGTVWQATEGGRTRSAHLP